MEFGGEDGQYCQDVFSEGFLHGFCLRAVQDCYGDAQALADEEDEFRAEAKQAVFVGKD